MKDKRREERYVVTFPVVVESQGRYFFVTRARNVAKSGLLVMISAKLEVGEPVVITYRVEGECPQDHDVKGTIVWVDENEGEGKGDWPYLAAVEFSGPLPQLIELLGENLTSASSEELSES